MRGGSVERRCAVPAGKALFFPVVNAFAGFIYVPNPAPGDEPDVTGARADLKAWIDTASNLACEIDGVPIANLTAYREQSPAFRFVLPEGNLFGAPAGIIVDPTVDDGIYLR